MPEIYSKKFGFKTGDIGFNVTKCINITITVFLNRFQYQCKMEVNQSNEFYLCDITDKLVTTECIFNSSNVNNYENGIQIDNNNSDLLLIIDQFIIMDDENDDISIFDMFCFEYDEYENNMNDTDCLDILPIDNNESFFIPLNLTNNQQNNENIAFFSPMKEFATCHTCKNDYVSPIYGDSEGGINGHPLQGRISGISSWGIRSGTTNTIKSLWNIKWTSDGDTTCIQYYNRSTTSCQPFKLSQDDYINGYQVIYDDYYVYGLTFYTNNNLSFSCISYCYNYPHISAFNDSGIIIFDNHYLSGFVLHLNTENLIGIKMIFTPFGDDINCMETYKYFYIAPNEQHITWEEAENYCLSTYDTHLATIITDTDMEIARYLQNSEAHGIRYLWIGLIDKDDDKKWEWIDGTSCNYTQTGLCIDDKHWQIGTPLYNSNANNKNHGFLSFPGYFINALGWIELWRFGFLCGNPLIPGTVTFAPTTSPTFDPTNNPTTNPTLEPTSAPFVKIHKEGLSVGAVAGIVSGLGIVIIIICLVIYYLWRKKVKQEKEDEEKTMWIQNPMVIAVCIGHYDEPIPEDSEIEGRFKDLDGIDEDIKNANYLFVDTLNYKMFPNYNLNEGIKQRWTLKELSELFDEKAQELERNIDKYDGLCVIISCHGIKDFIVTSDYKKCSKLDVHRNFSSDKPSVRKIPRLFLFDCCSGDSERVPQYRGQESSSDDSSTESKNYDDDGDEMEKNEKGKNKTKESVTYVMSDVEVEKQLGADEISDEELWQIGEDNPDYRLITINAANDGFQAKMSVVSGSYVITDFTRLMVENITNKDNKQWLFEVLDKIQQDLHEQGKQQIVNTFNNRTRFVKFRRNNDGKELKENQEEGTGMDEIGKAGIVEGGNGLGMIDEEDGINKTTTKREIEMQEMDDKEISVDDVDGFHKLHSTRL